MSIELLGSLVTFLVAFAGHILVTLDEIGENLKNRSTKFNSCNFETLSCLSYCTTGVNVFLDPFVDLFSGLADGHLVRTSAWGPAPGPRSEPPLSAAILG